MSWLTAIQALRRGRSGRPEGCPALGSVGRRGPPAITPATAGRPAPVTGGQAVSNIVARHSAVGNERTTRGEGGGFGAPGARHAVTIAVRRRGGRRCHGSPAEADAADERPVAARPHTPAPWAPSRPGRAEPRATTVSGSAMAEATGPQSVCRRNWGLADSSPWGRSPTETAFIAMIISTNTNSLPTPLAEIVDRVLPVQFDYASIAVS